MDDLLYEALSPDELMQLWRRKRGTAKAPKVVTYDEITSSKSLEAVFGNNDNLIVYYPGRKTNEGTFGHYVALIRNQKNNTIYFYDSYGGKPDVDQKRFSDSKLYDEEENTLIRLLLDSGYNVDDNQFKHQAGNGIATCGRWSLLRNKYAELTNDQFNDLVKYATKKMNVTPDEWAVLEFH